VAKRASLTLVATLDARRPTVAQLVSEIAANIHSIEAGGGLLQQIDMATGY